MKLYFILVYDTCSLNVNLINCYVTLFLIYKNIYVFPLHDQLIIEYLLCLCNSNILTILTILTRNFLKLHFRNFLTIL